MKVNNCEGPHHLDPSLLEHHISETLTALRVFVVASASTMIKGDVDIN